MIVSDLEHIGQQAVMTPRLRQAIAFLRRRDIHELPDGRVELDGDRLYAIIQRYETTATEAPTFEYHRKYLDVQFIASGEEVIGWAPAARLAVTEAYDAERDICFGRVAPEQWTAVHLQAGQLMVLWPEDGHAPKLAYGKPAPVMKIVVKVSL